MGVGDIDLLMKLKMEIILILLNWILPFLISRRTERFLDEQNFNSRCEIFFSFINSKWIKYKIIPNRYYRLLIKFLTYFHKEFRLLVELFKWFDESSFDWRPIPSSILPATNPASHPAVHPASHPAAHSLVVRTSDETSERTCSDKSSNESSDEFSAKSWDDISSDEVCSDSRDK